MFPLSETEKSSGVFPAQHPWAGWAAILENLLTDLALGFEAVQSRPMTTFPKDWHDNILEVLPHGFVSPVLQSGDIDKIAT